MENGLYIELGADVKGLLDSLELVKQKLKATFNQAMASAGGIENIMTKMSNSVTGEVSYTAKALDGLRKQFPDLQKQMQEAGEASQRMGEKLSKSITIPLSLLAGTTLKASADLEALTLGLQTTMGSASAAQAELVKLNEASKMPGLGFKQVVEGSVSLQAAGFEADFARRSLIGFGNALASAGKGKAELDGINLALTQLASSPKVLQEEINQIRERLPQFTSLMINAFGSSRSEDIQKLGITGKQFVERMVVELEKLPKATVGLKAAWENSTDSMSQSAARFGDILARNFNVSELLGKATDALEKATTAFAGLSPANQSAIITLGALAAGTGPVMLAFGTLTTTVIPALKTAFIGLNSTMGIVGLTIGAAVTAYGMLKADMDAVAFAQSHKNKALSEAKSKLKDVKEGTEKYDAALKHLQGTYLKAALAQAELEASTTSYMDYVKASILTIFDGIPNNYKETLESIQKVKSDKVKELTQAYKDLFNAAEPKKGTKADNKPPVDPEAAKKALEDYVKNQLEASKSIGESMIRVRDLSISLIKDETERKRAELKAQAADRRAQVAAEVQSEKQKAKEIAAINEKLAQDLRALSPNVQRIDTVALGNGKTAENSTPALRNAITLQMSGFGKDANVPTNAAKMMQKTIEEMQVAAENLAKKTFDPLLALKETIGSALADATAAAVEGMSNLIGGMMTGTAKLAELPKLLGGVLASLAKQIGSAMIKFGLAGMAIQKLAISPVGAIAAGAGLIALSAALQAQVNQSIQKTSSSAPKFAEGWGGAVGRTLAWFGDNHDARTNQEFILRKDQVKSILNRAADNAGGKGGLKGEFILRGKDLKLALKRADDYTGNFS